MTLLIGVVFSSVGYAGGSGGNHVGHEVVQGSRAWPHSPVISDQQATLNWKAPETRENGDVLGRYDVTSYKILYGQNANRLDSEVVVDGTAGLYDLSFTIEHLAPGTWYFAIQAKDDDGLLSVPSKVVSKRISG